MLLRSALLFVCALLLSTIATATVSPIIRYDARFHPKYSDKGMVVAAEPIAANIGADILKKGGNAVDAAVATGFALAVTLPRAGNLGGGGFMLISDTRDKKAQVTALDYRETAPNSAHKGLFLDEAGNVSQSVSRFSAKSIGIPGTVAGLLAAHEKYGALPLSELIKPAILIAKNGFFIDYALADSLGRAVKRLQKYPSTANIFLPNNDVPKVGDKFIQSDLANTLSLIAKYGKKGFYEGKIAEKITQAIQENNGIVTLADFKAYTPKFRVPIQVEAFDHTFYMMPPSSAGGVLIGQMLKMLAGANIQNMSYNSAEYLHVLSEVTKRSFADRSTYLGDPDFSSNPIQALLSDDYLTARMQGFHRAKATIATEIAPGNLQNRESPETTHYTVADGKGLVVSNTYTLNFSYGSGLVAEGTGVLLNNELDDFAAKPGVPNAFGLTGGERNAVGPNKRPLSSMTPTIVLKDGQFKLALGSPGGSRIITALLQVLLGHIVFEQNIQTAVSLPRVHHQWLPDVLSYEQGISLDTLNLLRQKGHDIKQTRNIGAVLAIAKTDSGLLAGGADPRRMTATVAAD